MDGFAVGFPVGFLLPSGSKIVGDRLELEVGVAVNVVGDILGLAVGVAVNFVGDRLGLAVGVADDGVGNLVIGLVVGADNVCD